MPTETDPQSAQQSTGVKQIRPAYYFSCEDESLNGPAYSPHALYYKVMLLSDSDEEASDAEFWAEKQANPFFNSSYYGHGFFVSLAFSEKGEEEAAKADWVWEERYISTILQGNRAEVETGKQ